MRSNLDYNNFKLISEIFWVFLFYSYLIGSDLLIKQKPFATRNFWAIYDVVVHASVGMFVLYPILEAKKFNIFYVVAVVIFSTLIDFDHAIAAHSLSIRKMITLDHRPLTHSLLFSLVISLFFFKIFNDIVLAYIIFIALTSHIIRDASGGLTPILWPMDVFKVPYWLYYCTILFFYEFSRLFASKFL